MIVNDSSEGEQNTSAKVLLMDLHKSLMKEQLFWEYRENCNSEATTKGLQQKVVLAGPQMA